MWKYIVAFVVFAALALWLLMKGGGDIDLSGEKHEVPATQPSEKANK
ncbi:MAG TPA: hypothetical protein PLJ16_14110 [Casimicrobium huifangae]|jgi:hypothetical protein|nr:hypothetical protein [Casimicrobium huifangae]